MLFLPLGKTMEVKISEYLERSGSFILKDTIPMDFHLKGQKKQKNNLRNEKNPAGCEFNMH